MKAEAIKELFDTHPTVDVFYTTTDNQAFFVEEMADAHGQKLADRKVTKVSRDLAELINEVVGNSATEGAGDGTEETGNGDGAGDDTEETGHGESDSAGDGTDETGDDAGDGTTAKTPTQIALDTPEAERTPTQKGLVTKAAKAAKPEGEQN